MLAAKLILALVLAVIGPSFNALAMLKVVSPFAFVLGTVHMLVGTCAVGLIIRPKAIVHISINMKEFTTAVGFVFAPLSDILGAILPYLDPLAISEAAFPLASVGGPSLKLIGFPLFPRLVMFVDSGAYRLASLILRKVLAGAHLFGLQHAYTLTSLSAPPPGLDKNNVADPLLQIYVVVPIAT